MKRDMCVPFCSAGSDTYMLKVATAGCSAAWLPGWLPGAGTAPGATGALVRQRIG